MVKFQNNIAADGKATLVAEYNNTLPDLQEQAFKAFVAQAQENGKVIEITETSLNNRTTVTFAIV
jgi:endo-alpha-1,4-polygalactosaminidase (GH114 family)